mgnify:CR=1 FL=1
MAPFVNVKLQSSFKNPSDYKESIKLKIKNAPWWLFGIFIVAIATLVTIATNESFQKAFDFIKAGLWVTISTTLMAFVVALFIGLLTGLGRISNNILVKMIILMCFHFV